MTNGYVHEGCGVTDYAPIAATSSSVLRRGRELEVIEIKLTTQPTSEDMARLDKVAAMLGAKRQVLLTRSKASATRGARWSTNLPGYLAAAL